MKIALCYSGHIRTWERCAPNHYDHLVKANPNDKVDAYFYTFESPENNWIKPHQYVRCPQSFYENAFGEHKFNSRKRPETQAHQVLNMFHNNMVGFSLIPKEYDFYVRLRCDIKLNGDLIFSQYGMQANTVYIPKGHDYWGLNDQFAFGDWDSMRIYFMVYQNCEYFFTTRGYEFNAEIYNSHNLNENGITVKRFDHPQHDIIR